MGRFTASPNQTPEQIARDNIDNQLLDAGWIIQTKETLNPNAALGVAVREYPTDTGPMDYALFVEGKPVGVIEAKAEKKAQNITTVEEQSGDYADATLKWVNNREPLKFVFEATGVITRFTDRRDPKPRAREIFRFFRPETLNRWIKQDCSVRTGFTNLPPLNDSGLRECQIEAIEALDASLAEDRPRALVQMATGSGKTFTAITSVYRLLKHTNLQRVLFLVDTKNLGKQAEQEFMAYQPNDDNRKFTELYSVQRLSSSFVPSDAQVCISTIQRMYSILKGEELEDAAEEQNPWESKVRPREPLPVAYNEKIPPEFFDLIIIDECHRSIFNLWRQVLEYFDAHLVGLTATPDNRSVGFFEKNVVSHYTHEQAVAGGVNVGGEVWLIDTQISRGGATLVEDQSIEKRERLTRRKRWEIQEATETYSAQDLDKDVVNLDVIRTIVREYKEKYPIIFPGRSEVPKTLIFAKTDSHADDIINMVRTEFGEGNDFCKKITYRTEENTDSLLSRFRNDYYPRIAVTVDMIATGTDVKPLECVMFMRDVRSANYFEQMKGRGTRTYDYEKLKSVTPSATSGKTHYVIIDAVGVTKSLKTVSKPLITKKNVPFEDLARGVMMGVRDEETVSSLAGRLSRLARQLDDKERSKIREEAGGLEIEDMASSLISAIDPDNIEDHAREKNEIPPSEPVHEQKYDESRDELVGQASQFLTGPLIDCIASINRSKEQTIDHDNLDTVIQSGWSQDAIERASSNVSEFEQYLLDNQDEIEALTIYFKEPHRRAAVTYKMISEVLEKLKSEKPHLMPLEVWRAYKHLDKVTASDPISELTALVSLIRRVCGLDATITAFADTVKRNFQTWIMSYHSGGSEKFNSEQMDWLHMIRDHVITSASIGKDDFELSPFDRHGGLGKVHQLFGSDTNDLVDSLNETLVA
ncbi:MAG: restriction endonuclease subunit R [Dehalococcoidia bacterium]|nr:restriction endonuclease subunit R [Dehalococcoidia bacterium]